MGDLDIRFKLMGVLLLSLFCANLVFVSADQVTIQLGWDGGTASCKNCTDNSTIWTPQPFACSNGHGNWNGGVANFMDPLPQSDSSWIVTQVIITVVGRFNCNLQLQGANLIFELESGIITIEQMPADPQGCFCPYCTIARTFASQEYDAGWRGYQYGGMNALSVMLGDIRQSICLSYINMTLFYTPANPDIFALLPPAGPIDGNTSVTIWGTDFYPHLSYMCLFGQEESQAIFVESTHLVCYSPKAPGGHDSQAPFYLKVEANNEIIDPKLYFQYYSPVNPQSLIPNSGPAAGGQMVYVVGTNFINLKILRCMWGTQPIPATYINSTHILCNSTSGTGTVNVSVSENGQQYSKPLVYTFVPAPQNINTTTTSWFSKIPGWLVVLAGFGGVTALVTVVLFVSKRCGRNDDDEHEPLLSIRNNRRDSLLRKINMSHVKTEECIGKGTFGEVFRGTWNGTEVGIKFLRYESKDEGFWQDFYKEVEIMRALNHPNVLQFLGFSTSPPEACIIMEYMPRGSLYKILHDKSLQLNNEMIRRMMIDATRGMNYLHRSEPPIIHRDLKSHNFLVDENWKVKVSDFGLSKILDNTTTDVQSMTACGTPSWTAPEIVRGEHYTEMADVYSFGIVLWECMTRADPHEGIPAFQVVVAVASKKLRPEIRPDIPANWADLMQRCWDEDPLVRPSFGEIIHVLEGMKDENDLLASPRKSMLSINDSPMAVGVVTRGSGMEEHIFTPNMPTGNNSTKKAGSVSNFKPLATNNSSKQNSFKGMINPDLPVGLSLQNSGKY